MDSQTITVQIGDAELLTPQKVKVQLLTPGATLNSGLSNAKVVTVTQ